MVLMIRYGCWAGCLGLIRAMVDDIVGTMVEDGCLTMVGKVCVKSCGTACKRSLCEVDILIFLRGEWLEIYRAASGLRYTVQPVVGDILCGQVEDILWAQWLKIYSGTSGWR